MSNALEQLDLDVNSLVADNVRAELSRQRWSGRKAANALGLGNAYLARRLSGEVPLSPSELVMLSSLLEVSISRFFVGTDNSPVREVHPPGLEPGTHWLRDSHEILRLSDYRDRRGERAVVEGRGAVVTPIGAMA